MSMLFCVMSIYKPEIYHFENFVNSLKYLVQNYVWLYQIHIAQTQHSATPLRFFSSSLTLSSFLKTIISQEEISKNFSYRNIMPLNNSLIERLQRNHETRPLKLKKICRSHYDKNTWPNVSYSRMHLKYRLNYGSRLSSNVLSRSKWLR